MSSATQPESSSAQAMSTAEASSILGQAIREVQQVIVGQEHMVEQLMVALLAKGHCLLEGVPGVAKTLAVRSFATVVGGTFSRIQFTPDLVPSDIVGTRIYSASTETFRVELGPVFVNFVLADEINRAPAKVQSAMLELMAEKQVSLGGQTHKLPDPFIVIATQNPVESEGVYPLPEAQRDRFLLKVDVPYPRGDEEFQILQRMSVRPPESQRILDPDLVRTLQTMSSEVFVHNLVAEYAVRLVLATRTPAEFDLPDLESVIQIGCSPRATLGLVAAARALALIHGRDYVLPTDIQAVAKDVMSHRLVLGFDAVAENIAPSQVIERIVAMVPAPTPMWQGEADQPPPPQHHAPQPPGGQYQPGQYEDGQPHAGHPQAAPSQAGQQQTGQNQAGQTYPGQAYPPPSGFPAAPQRSDPRHSAGPPAGHQG